MITVLGKSALEMCSIIQCSLVKLYSIHCDTEFSNIIINQAFVSFHVITLALLYIIIVIIIIVLGFYMSLETQCTQHY